MQRPHHSLFLFVFTVLIERVIVGYDWIFLIPIQPPALQVGEGGFMRCAFIRLAELFWLDSDFFVTPDAFNTACHSRALKVTQLTFKFIQGFEGCKTLEQGFQTSAVLIMLCHGCCSVRCRMSSSTRGLHTLDASSSPSHL